MTKGRKTTQEERAQIVAFCIEHGTDYALTAETYKVSYQQIYSWVKKYETAGVDGLVDRRGKAKAADELTEAERAQIVAFCIEHGKDYALTVETYQVSYQQIYSWVRKYEASGVDGLVDRRGKAKPENELTEAERLRQENRMLQAMLKDKEMEIALLKKLRELRGGGWSAE